MKYITLRKHKPFDENNKTFIINFHKSSKELLQNSNIFTKYIIIDIAKKIVKQEQGSNVNIYVNKFDHHSWMDQVYDNINVVKFKLKLDNTDLLNNLNNLENFFKLNYNFNDFNNFNDVINFINQKFNELYQSN